MSRLKTRTATAAAVLFCAALPLRLPGAIANISVVNNAFQPASTNIFVNDTVVWTWGAGSQNHNVTSTSNPKAWTWTASLDTDAPFTYSLTFGTNGTYPYDCTVHATIGMVGSVTVAAAPKVPPAVTITSPTNGTVYAAPANVAIQATASDSDATVTNVQFLIGSTVVSNRTVSPFAANTNNLVSGGYTIAAVATDTAGLKNTNSVAISVVTPLTLTVSSPHKTAGTFQFNYTANTGLSYVVQKATNLANAVWVPVSTNQAGANPVAFTDSHATNAPGFYRVGRMPNP